MTDRPDTWLAPPRPVPAEPPPLATVLPRHLAERLRRAARRTARGAGIDAIDDEVADLKHHYPQYFKKEAP